MLVWINGAFGAGKTQTTFELHRRVPGSHVADPELIGHALHKMLPPAARLDYQDRPQWRSAVTRTLIDAVEAHDGPVIVPMTLVNGAYFDEIVGGLRAAGVDVRHFALIASPETLRLRLRSRASFLMAKVVGRGENWAMEQIDRCVTALATDKFAVHVDTDDREIDDVVEEIAERAGLELTEPRLPAARYQLRRLTVGLRHIRL
ncbi:AAA family ATPase [Antrihabitans cavernicola]|uniref:AAA family ATPase n=1 Tax=Antrihabitans cavernicola TaxID=2495913 RepID=A0A5A7S617_9NOCA|nr:AAA family ATPase [Spelaeibacter cavernicola]KAA0018977.1 AAA family ATPase [Spelaeibacter cavernicola]